MSGNSVVASIFAVFTEILNWFTTTLGSVGDIFYTAETGLTFIGTLSVIGLGIGVVLLVVNMLKSLIRFK